MSDPKNKTDFEPTIKHFQSEEEEYKGLMHRSYDQQPDDRPAIEHFKEGNLLDFDGIKHFQDE